MSCCGRKTVICYYKKCCFYCRETYYRKQPNSEGVNRGMYSENLKKKQEEVYNYVRKAIVSHKGAPSVREIGAAVGLRSTASVVAHLDILEQKGYIKKSQGKARNIELISGLDNCNFGEAAAIPVINDLSDAEYICKSENIDKWIPLLIDQEDDARKVFATRMSGNSLIDIGIFNGDCLIVKEGAEVKDRSVIVTKVDGNIIFNRVYIVDDNMLRLQPENKEMYPIFLDKKDMTVIGTVIGIYRRL